MPVAIERPSSTHVAHISRVRERRMRRGTVRDRGRRIEIGLVNNMPDAAILATERQFSSLLGAASGRMDVRLHFYALRDVPRSDDARAVLTRAYKDAAQLRGGSLDALIVTGAEPIAATLREEPYWSALAELIDWADANTFSTILSCLAAHAGVLHLDKIARQPLPAKRSGVFAFQSALRHRLASGFDAQPLTPHSRRNGLDAKELVRQDYQLLTFDDEIGVDAFVKQRQSLFLFLQGHPEYEDNSLAREYRRDMNRFLRGEQPMLPEIPANYYSAHVERALAAFGERARRARRSELMQEFPDAGVFGAGEAPWRRHAVRLYGNWLTLVADRKAETQDASALVARWGG